MRTKSDLIIFGCYVTYPGGSFMAGDVPINALSTGVGTFTVNFDSRIRPISVAVSGDNVQRAVSQNGVAIPGAFYVARYITSTGGLENGGFNFVCIARDTRMR